MSIKGDLVSIYEVTDKVSGGWLETLKNTMSNVYKGHFEDKFNDMMKLLLKNKITENEVLEWVDSLWGFEKDIYFSIVNKNLLSESEIKRFLLSKILFYQIRNGKLDYFHSNILTNIDLFVEDDFNVFNIICNQNEKNIQHTFETDSYKTTISKFKTIGIIPMEDFIVSESSPKCWDESNYKFNKETNDYESLCKYINEYFSS